MDFKKTADIKFNIRVGNIRSSLYFQLATHVNDPATSATPATSTTTTDIIAGASLQGPH